MSRSRFITIICLTSLCECNEYKLCKDWKLIRSYKITMGHQLLGLVCTVDSSTFHWPLNSPRVVRKGLWFIVEDEEPLAGKKVALDSRVGSKHTRQRQRERESMNQIWVWPVIKKLSPWIYMSLYKIKIQGTWVSYFLDSHFEHSTWSVIIRCQIKKHLLAGFTGLQTTGIVKTWTKHETNTYQVRLLDNKECKMCSSREAW